MNRYDAEAFCEERGGWLCSIEELDEGACCKKQCGIRGKPVWTRTTCDAIVY